MKGIAVGMAPIMYMPDSCCKWSLQDVEQKSFAFSKNQGCLLYRVKGDGLCIREMAVCLLQLKNIFFLATNIFTKAFCAIKNIFLLFSLQRLCSIEGRAKYVETIGRIGGNLAGIVLEIVAFITRFCLYTAVALKPSQLENFSEKALIKPTTLVSDLSDLIHQEFSGPSRGPVDVSGETDVLVDDPED